MISICIPSRGPVVGLWATIHACHAQLEGVAEEEYIVVVNGKESGEPYHLLTKNSGGRVTIIDSKEPMPPPLARNYAAEKASGEFLFFFDDHCIPARDYFPLMLLGLKQHGGVFHSSYTTHIAGPRYYHFKLNRDCPAKGDYCREAPSTAPYRCAAAPTGGFAVHRKLWEKTGGMDYFWKGFGGEEPYFDLKAWMLGYEVWMEPRALYYHFSCRAETRGYDKTFNEDNFKEAYRRLGPPELATLMEFFAAKDIPY